MFKKQKEILIRSVKIHQHQNFFHGIYEMTEITEMTEMTLNIGQCCILIVLPGYVMWLFVLSN